ncbi:MAG: vWA domain-containing protein [Thermoprotei archaeon]
MSVEKPPCRFDSQSADDFTSFFGQDMVEELLYSMFNPEGMESTTQDMDNDDLDRLIEEQMAKWEEIREGVEQRLSVNKQNWMYRDWLEEKMKREFVRRNAWQELVEAIKQGKLDPKSIPLNKLTQMFASEIAKGLEKEGYLELRNFWDSQRGGYTLGWFEFTAAGERIIARKVLEEVLENLMIPCIEYGDEQRGLGVNPSDSIMEYDEFLHHYDLIDVYETMLSGSLRRTNTIFDAEDIKVRVPSSRYSSSNVILIDSSNSMYGPKFRGAITAALAFKRLLEEYFKDDELYVVAYDDEPVLVKEGEILRLRPQGNTDIGSAIDFAVELLKRCEGNRNIFLITDGEPTSSCYTELNPEENAYRAARRAGLEEVNLNIVLLDQKPELRAIADNMARINGRSTVTYVGDPQRLKDFFVRNYMAQRGVGVKRLTRRGLV